MNDSRAAADFSTVRDFPDRISPMVVKELRQGLRGRYFASTFVGFHALLWVIMVSAAQDAANTGMIQLIWWLLGAVMLILLPLRGLSALSEERQSNTMDTLVLSNLSAGRIVRGKWLAIAAQISLVAVSAIPYVIMMYLARGLSLPLCLATLFRLWLTGLLLTAAFVSISWNASWLVRAGLAMAAVYFAQAVGIRKLRQLLDGGPGYQDSGIAASGFGREWTILLSGAAAMSVAGFILLELAAEKLAPHENHSGKSRAAALFCIVATTLLSLFSASSADFMRTWCLWILALVSVFAMTEKMPDARKRRGGVWRWGPFESGWKHGVLFCALAWTLLVAVFSVTGHDDDQYWEALRLTAWLFWGRLLLLPFSRLLPPGPFPLLGMGILFVLLQAGLKILGNLISESDFLNPLAELIPSPYQFDELYYKETTLFLPLFGMICCVTLVLVRFYLLAKRPNPDSQAESAPESAA